MSEEEERARKVKRVAAKLNQAKVMNRVRVRIRIRFRIRVRIRVGDGLIIRVRVRVRVTHNPGQLSGRYV
jgi:hypothetical protein